MDELIIKSITNVHEYLFASFRVLDESFKTTVLLCRCLPTSWVVVVGLTTQGFQGLMASW
jgi:hypothetical protein